MNARAVRHLVSEIAPCDAVVVGSGVAGLSAALALAPLKVTLVTKTELARGGSSNWAQGGVAAALAEDDSPREHAADTLAAAAGLADADAVAVLTSEGPSRIRELIEIGARFDRDADGHLSLGREGAHGRRRILHAGGDATGAEMVRALNDAVHRAEHVEVRERTFAEDLVLSDDGRVVGLVVHDGAERVFLHAAAVILATGGYGQLYARTTNPPAVTGDGVAMAARAGAELADLEFVQFHPTALLANADPLPLVTEALRGEGAVLVNDRGKHFMTAIHPRAELAPRDVVARAIFREQQQGQRVRLDATQALGERFPQRFPTVYEHCRGHGLDPRREPIPVTPAAHYAMGGIAVDGYGQASLDGLWACGETSSSGVHGANRLASNSLLEALVFGARVAEDVRGRRPGTGPRRLDGQVWRETGTCDIEAADLRGQLRTLMWNRGGLAREGKGLEEALGELEGLATGLPAVPSETGNLLTMARLVTAAALARQESRGAHYRSDFPTSNEAEAYRRVWTYRPIGEFPLAAASLPARREIA